MLRKRNSLSGQDLWPIVKFTKFPGIICAQISDFGTLPRGATPMGVF
jgi:hypothetical protein